MALGALIGAYHEDDHGGLSALLPLAGRTLVEYQARSAAAAGASPVVVLVEQIPPALNQAFERLRQEGVNVVPVSDGNEAASRFQAGELILVIGDGVAAPVELLTDLADGRQAAVLTVPDDEAHRNFERIDGVTRWSGVALVEGGTLGATAAMLGDWDLPSTLLRRALQGGAPISRAAPESEPLLARTTADLEQFERALVRGSRRFRTDAVSRYVLPPLEDLATDRLTQTSVRPEWLMYLALALTFAATFAFTHGWNWAALLMLLLSTPLDLIAFRLGHMRLKPLPTRVLSKRLLWPAAGVALVALGWWEARHGSGWGAVLAAATAAAFAQAYRLERVKVDVPVQPWLMSRRNAIWLSIPFAFLAAWTGYLIVILIYAAASFFIVQHLAHRMGAELTTH